MIKNKMVSDTWTEIPDEDDDGSATVGSDVGLSVDLVITIIFYFCVQLSKSTQIPVDVGLLEGLIVGSVVGNAID